MSATPTWFESYPSSVWSARARGTWFSGCCFKMHSAEMSAWMYGTWWSDHCNLDVTHGEHVSWVRRQIGVPVSSTDRKRTNARSDKP